MYFLPVAWVEMIVMPSAPSLCYVSQQKPVPGFENTFMALHTYKAWEVCIDLGQQKVHNSRLTQNTE